MKTLIAATGSAYHRHCTPRCYMAEGGRCRCVCGGRFHGLGLEEAEQELTAMDRDEFRAGFASSIKLYFAPVQIELPLMGVMR